jgi:probable RNA-binding protein EIF1AD
MSIATKRKHVHREFVSEQRLPDEDEDVVRVLGGRGNNLHEVQDSRGKNYLVSMPMKFRRSVWIKRGDYVLAQRIPEGDKVKAEISGVLNPASVKFLKSNGAWPEEFNKEQELDPEDFINTNRPPPYVESSSSSDEESDT